MVEYVVPDAIEPITSYRAFRVEMDDGGAPCLASVHLPHCFFPSPTGRRVEYQAACNSPETLGRTPHEQALAGPHHRCGFYSKLSFEGAEHYALFHGGHLLGRVRCFGKVIPGDRGWRAEKLQLDALYAWGRPSHRRLLSELADRYGVPVIEPPPRSRQTSPGGRLDDWVADHGMLTWAASFVTLTGAIAAAGNWLDLHPWSLYVVLVVFPILGINTASVAMIQRPQRRR